MVKEHAEDEREGEGRKRGRTKQKGQDWSVQARECTSHHFAVARRNSVCIVRLDRVNADGDYT